MSRIVHKFGRNPDVGNGTWELITTAGGAGFWPQTAQTAKLHSSTAADTSTGTGARSVTLVGLSSSWDEQTETINTAGTSTATGTKKWIRLFRAYVETAGTYGGLFAGSNRGTITIRTSTGATLATIAATTGGGTVGFGQTQIGHYTIPDGFNGYLGEAMVSVNASKPADVALFQRPNADDTAAPVSSVRVVQYQDGVDGAHELHSAGSIPNGPFPPRTDLFFAAKGNGQATSVTVDFEVLLYPTGIEQEFGY